MTEDPVSLRCPICNAWFALEARNPATHDAPQQQQQPAQKLFFGGECKTCRGEVWVPWKPREGGGLLCARCFALGRPKA